MSEVWRWYCRWCGQQGDCNDATLRTEQAVDHIRVDHGSPSWPLTDEAGHLLHVWPDRQNDWRSDPQNTGRAVAALWEQAKVQQTRDSLKGMEHDLDAGCMCSTCVEVLNIAHTYK